MAASEIPIDVLLYVVAPMIPDTMYKVNRQFYKMCAPAAKLEDHRARFSRWIDHYGSGRTRDFPNYFRPAVMLIPSLRKQIKQELQDSPKIAFVNWDTSLEFITGYEVYAAWERPDGSVGWLATRDDSDQAIHRYIAHNLITVSGRLPLKITDALGDMCADPELLSMRNQFRIFELLVDQFDGEYTILCNWDRLKYVKFLSTRTDKLDGGDQRFH